MTERWDGIIAYWRAECLPPTMTSSFILPPAYEIRPTGWMDGEAIYAHEMPPDAPVRKADDGGQDEN